MGNPFLAKFGGTNCQRCGQLVRAGQKVYFTGFGKALAHWPVCPPPVVAEVVFRYACGCKAGECVHFPGE